MKWPRREKETEMPPAEPESNGKVVRSLEEESHETLTLLELKGTPRDQKLALERELYDGAQEVELAEKGFHRRRRENLDDVRAFVDALPDLRGGSGPVEVRVEPAPAPAPAPAPESVNVNAPAPAPAPAPEAAAPPLEKPGRHGPALTDEEKALFRRKVPGKLLEAVVLYETTVGRVVEARYRQSDASEARRLYVLVNGEVKDLADIQGFADTLKPKHPLPSEPPAAPAAAPDEPSKDEGKKKRGLFGRKK